MNTQESLIVNSEVYYNLMTGARDAEGKNFIILDVRTAPEIQSMSVESLVGDKNNFDVLFSEISEFEQLTKEQITSDVGIAEGVSVLCMCGGGVRSQRANLHLRSFGFDSYNVEGGIKAFAAFVLPQADE